MHRTTKAVLSSFLATQSEGMPTELNSQFEYFVNYCATIDLCITMPDLSAITTSDSDCGIDGIAIIADEESLTSLTEAEDLFSSKRRKVEVVIVITQAKTGEKYDLGDVLKFIAEAEAVLTDQDYVPNCLIEREAHEIINHILSKSHKVRGNAPLVRLIYANSGVHKQQSTFSGKIETFTKRVDKLELYQPLEFEFWDRHRLNRAWDEIQNGIETELHLLSTAQIPTTDKVKKAFLGVARASEFIENVLSDNRGRIRSLIFESNVRAFLGESNATNENIGKTLRDGERQKLFPMLNNGITIISPNIDKTGTSIKGELFHFEGVQIINGCQTSSMLFRNREAIDDDTTINLKIIETSDHDIISDLVQATNSQSQVKDSQFYSLRPIAKNIARYFDSYVKKDERIWFERRFREFAGKDVPAIRTFNINDVAKAVTSMFLGRPDLASRYPQRMYEVYGETIFSSENKELFYYTAAFTIYRIHLLTSNKVIPQDSRKFKWHLLHVIRILVNGRQPVSLKNKKNERVCNAILKAVKPTKKETSSIILAALDIIKSLPSAEREDLKKTKTNDDLEELTLKARRSDEAN